MARIASFKNLARLAPILAWLFALALTAWVGAYWYWRLAGATPERSQYAVQTDPVALGQEVASRHLFGAQTQNGEAEPISSGRFQLIGVVANLGEKHSFAIIQETGQTASIAAIEGEDFASGIKLLKVNPQSVEILRNGTKEVLKLMENKNAVLGYGMKPAHSPSVPQTAPVIKTVRHGWQQPPPNRGSSPREEQSGITNNAASRPNAVVFGE